MRRCLPALLAALLALLASPRAMAQRGAVYCNVTEVKSEQLSNGVRVTIVADGEIQWDWDIARMEAEGAMEVRQESWGTWIQPTERFTRMYLRLYNARSMLGSAFVPVGKYPVSHVEIGIPEWASEGVGLRVDIVNYLGWVTGEGDQQLFRYNRYADWSEDRTSIVITWTSDRLPLPPPPATPADLPSELSVAGDEDGLDILAVNARISDIANAIAARADLPVSTPADSDLRISLALQHVSPPEAIAAVAAGCGLCTEPRSDGAWVLSAGVSKPGGYQVAATRRIELRHLRAREALDLLPSFLLDYIHADEEGNAIIVTGSAAMCDRVAADLAELDAAPPEVAVDVVAVEYTSAEAFARSLWLERYVGDLAAAFDALTGDLGFLWLEGLPRGWYLAFQGQEARSSGHVTSRASLRVRNSRTGRVFAGQQRTIVIEQVNEGLTANLETVNVGTTLEVQPRVGEGDDVVLHMTTEVNTLSGTDPSSGLPVIARRSAHGIVRAPDGGTVLIAGLEMASQSRETRAIPVLGSLPLVGGFFRAPARSHSQTRLAIFLTPRIIRGQQAAEGTLAHD